ncbi:DUF2627 domain-containing protein [Halalkalibacillus sediminis]|uniref:DUF2627 domain-containing protein n=1 Tax=Halalkalibacillus sediminis TaxID=2018042 RepID=A0A2I0QX74_9BACI|nr:DUF2627 domain-containing protein [Halalkalibacillus sediminis]PKR78941.1 DUF2627 domain-containing protein [Halalkalibacillus sediminis]
MARFIALLLLVLPGFLAAYGIKLIRDAFFGEVAPVFLNVLVQLFAGLAFIVIGIGFIAGFIYHRDQKRQRTKNNRKEPIRKPDRKD